MPAEVETICVDIGNSGLRCVRLQSASQSDSATSPGQVAVVPWQGPVLRIDWPLTRSNSASRSSDNEVEQPTEVALAGRLDAWLSESSLTKQSQHLERRWLVSSVQRTIESQLRQYVAGLGESDYRVLRYQDLNLEVDVEFPERVGVDRLLAALAALAHCPARQLIVIQAGSAVTVDLVEQPRRFCGGAIMPGVPMMLRLLGQAADLLPEVAADELLNLPPLPGKNTAAAMSAGVASAVVGGVQHLIARYRDELGALTPVVLSGGDGPLLLPYLTGRLVKVDHLVLRGLAALVLGANGPSA